MKTAVLYIVTDDLWAGAEVVSWNLLRRLAVDERLDLTVLTFNEGQLTRKLRADRIAVAVVPEEGASLFGMLRQARRALAGRRFRVIHTHRLKEHVLALLLSWRWRGTKLVSTVHGLPEPIASDLHESLALRLKRRFNDLLLRRCFARVVAVSEDIRQHLLSRCGFTALRLTQIYNGIPARTLEPAPWKASGEIVIGTVGRLVPVKGYDFLLEVAARLSAKAPHATFRVLGDGPLRAELESRRDALGLQAKVVFESGVADPWPFYRALDVYLNTSRHEGIPLSVLEAMMCGKPVVAPRTGGIPEIIRSPQEGVLVAQYEPEAFAAACLELIGDEARRRRLGQGGRDAVCRRFSDERMAESYVNLYLALGARASG